MWDKKDKEQVPNDSLRQKLINHNQQNIEEMNIDFERQFSNSSFHGFKKEESVVDQEDNNPLEHEPDMFDTFELKYPNKAPYFYMFIAATFMSLNAYCAKMLTSTDTFEILFLRSLIMLALFLCYYQKDRPKGVIINDKKNKKLILWQSILGFISGAAFIYGIKFLPLSEAVTIMYTSPIFTGILSYLLLNEAFDQIQWALSFISLIGVIMLIRPSQIFINHTDLQQHLNITGVPYTHDQRFLGVIINLIQSILLSINLMMLKAKGQNIHPFTLVIFIMIITLIISPFLAVFSGLTSIGMSEFLYIFFMGFCYCASQFFMNKSYQFKDKLGTLRMINYLQVILAYFLDIFAIQDFPQLWSVCGTVLIVLSNIFILQRS